MDTEMIDVRPAIVKGLFNIIISLSIVIFAIIATIIYANKKDISKKKKIIMILTIWLVAILIELLIYLITKPYVF